MSGSRRRVAGFSLAEVLVSIVVLSIGLLGAAQMLLASVRSGAETAASSAALNLARELGEMVRFGAATKVVMPADADPRATSQCVGSAESCSPQELAQWNLRDWHARVSTALPEARVVMCRDDAPWDAAGGEYRWSCDSSAHTMVVKIGWTPKMPEKKPRASSPPRLVVPLHAADAGDA